MRETVWSLSVAGVGNLRRAVPSKKLLLYAEMHNENMAYNGETFICLWFKSFVTSRFFVQNLFENHIPLKGNTMGSRLKIENLYIAGFLDGGGSVVVMKCSRLRI